MHLLVQWLIAFFLLNGFVQERYGSCSIARSHQSQKRIRFFPLPGTLVGELGADTLLSAQTGGR